MLPRMSVIVVIIVSLRLGATRNMPLAGWKSNNKFHLKLGEDLSNWKFTISSTDSKTTVSWNGTTTPSKVEENSYIVMEITTAHHVSWSGCIFCLPSRLPNVTVDNAKDCDVIAVWFDKNGVGRICDGWSEGNQEPTNDLIQSWHLITLTQQDGLTKALVARQMRTNDKSDHDLTRPLYMAWTFGNHSDFIKKTPCTLSMDELRYKSYDEFAVFEFDPIGFNIFLSLFAVIVIFFSTAGLVFFECYVYNFLEDILTG